MRTLFLISKRGICFFTPDVTDHIPCSVIGYFTLDSSYDMTLGDLALLSESVNKIFNND